MRRDYVAEQQAQQAAWARVQSSMSTIREAMAEDMFNKGMAQDVIDECLAFLCAQRKYEAAREFLALLIELDRANWVVQHPERTLEDETPEYLRTVT